MADDKKPTTAKYNVTNETKGPRAVNNAAGKMTIVNPGETKVIELTDAEVSALKATQDRMKPGNKFMTITSVIGDGKSQGLDKK